MSLCRSRLIAPCALPSPPLALSIQPLIYPRPRPPLLPCRLYKANDAVRVLKEQEETLNTQILSGRRAARNLADRIRQLDAQSALQKESIYNAEFQIQQMERKVRPIKGGPRAFLFRRGGLGGAERCSRRRTHGHHFFCSQCHPQNLTVFPPPPYL